MVMIGTAKEIERGREREIGSLSVEIVVVEPAIFFLLLLVEEGLVVLMLVMLVEILLLEICATQETVGMEGIVETDLCVEMVPERIYGKEVTTLIKELLLVLEIETEAEALTLLLVLVLEIEIEIEEETWTE